MEIHITRDGNQSGPYTLAEVNDQLATGFLKPDDLAWHKDVTDWTPLHTIAGVNAPSGPKRPPPPPQQAAGTTGQPPSGHSVSPATSTAAIASLVCGVLGLVLGLPALLGLPLGIYAVIAIKKSGGRLQGNGLAIAGIVCSALACFVWIGLLAAIAIPNFAKARSTAQKNSCIANLKQIDGATQQWALENKKLAQDTYSLSNSSLKNG